MLSRVAPKHDMPTRVRANDRSTQSTKPRDTAHELSKTKPAVTIPPSSELSQEVNKIYLEYLSAEKYIRNFLTERAFNQVVGERKKLTRAITSLYTSSSDLLAASLVEFTRLSIDYRFWKASVHQIVHAGRIAASSQPSLKSDIQKFVSFFLEKGLKHLEELRDAVLERCPYTRNTINGGAVYSASSPADIEAAKVCHPRILLSIGDTHRYSNTLKLAMEAYELARSIDPGNGTAYHQLGLMALLQRDFLSAAYDFLRASYSPASVGGAKAQLQIAFDEALKVYNRSSSTFWCRMGNKPETRNRDTVAKEIWIYRKDDKIPQLPENMDTKESHWKKLSSSELSHRFCLTFALVIGKLWANIGTENLHLVAEECLVYFEGLLQREATFLPLRIIQVESLLMMLLDELRPKGSSNTLWITGIQFAMEIFTILSARLEKLIDLCDWDSPQMETLAIGVSTWVSWMEGHEKDWKSRRPRPLFSLKNILKPQDEVIQDRLDDTWTTFASLMTKLTMLFRRFSSTIFPPVVITNEDDKHAVLLSPFPEAKHIYGLAPLSNSYLFHHKHFCNSKLRASRGRNYIRLNSIFRFGLLFLYEEHKILQLRTVNGIEHFFSRVKIKDPYSESEVAGLDKSHYHFWIAPSVLDCKDSQRVRNGSTHRNPSTNPRLGDVNKACRIVVKEKESHSAPQNVENENSTSPIPPPQKLKPQLGRVKIHKTTMALWENLTKEGFATDIVIEPRNFVLDTNCFVRKLDMIKILICVSPRPLFIPVAVILELRGLSKGGLRKQDQVRYGSDVRNAFVQQKLVDGMELGEACSEALSFIASNMNYFRVITSSGNVLKIKTPHAFVKDDSFDPSDNNDDRILQSCRKLEELDLDLRDKDTTRRIYRRTVLLTSDRGLRLKSNLCYYIPARAITPVVFWLISQFSFQFYAKVMKSFTEIREKRMQKRKEKRDRSKALKKASSPIPKDSETKVTAILLHSDMLMINKV